MRFDFKTNKITAIRLSLLLDFSNRSQIDSVYLRSPIAHITNQIKLNKKQIIDGVNLRSYLQNDKIFLI
jgi:hypothetical protein